MEGGGVKKKRTGSNIGSVVLLERGGADNRGCERTAAYQRERVAQVACGMTRCWGGSYKEPIPRTKVYPALRKRETSSFQMVGRGRAMMMESAAMLAGVKERFSRLMSTQWPLGRSLSHFGEVSLCVLAKMGGFSE